MELSLKNKTALIGGASQGIGKAIAEELAGSGARCILLARNKEQLEKVAAALPVNGQYQHDFHSIDFNDREAVKDLIKQITSKETIHILVNNTGGPKAGPITEAVDDEFTKAFDQHLIINHILTMAVKEGMKQAGYGRIINIISTSVKIPLENLGVSNTIRGAVASWSKTMANELGRYGITVNNILPGLTETQRLHSLVKTLAVSKNITEDEVRSKMISEIPARRFGQASELAAVAAFLASPAAAYVNGVSIPVDGGKTGTI